MAYFDRASLIAYAEELARIEGIDPAEFIAWLEAEGKLERADYVALDQAVDDFKNRDVLSAPDFDQPRTIPRAAAPVATSVPRGDISLGAPTQGSALSATSVPTASGLTPSGSLPPSTLFPGFQAGSVPGATDSALRTKPHTGTDYPMPEGSAVPAVKAGRVIFAGNGHDFGTTVVLQHEDNTESQYSHLSKASVQPGMDVQSGTPIGLSGNTGLSDGPHLHYEENPLGHSRSTYGMVPGAEGGTIGITGRQPLPTGTPPPEMKRSFSEALSGPTTNAEGDRFFPLFDSDERQRQYAERNVVRRAGIEPNSSPIGEQTAGYVPQLRRQLDVRDALSGRVARPMADIAGELAQFLQQGRTNVFDDPMTAMRQIAALMPGDESLPLGQGALAQVAKDPDSAALLLEQLLSGYLSPMMRRALPGVLRGRSDAYRNLGGGAPENALAYYSRMFPAQ